MKSQQISLFLTVALCLGIATPATAFQLNAYSIFSDGSFLFLDDFEDATPTAMIDFPGSTTTESGGFLNFSPLDGGIFFGGDAANPLLRDEVYVDEILGLPASGTFVTGGFDSDLSQLTDNPLDAFSGFGITVAGTSATSPTGLTGAQLGVFNNFDLAFTGLLPPGEDPTPTVFFNDFNSGLLYGYDRLDPGTITGDIILDMFISDTGAIFPSYSIDGGLTFILASEWDSASDFGTFPSFLVFPDDNDVVGSAFGQAFIPLPPALALLAAPLGMLAAFGRRQQKTA